jgi:PAS domain S-box-containing protein
MIQRFFRWLKTFSVFSWQKDLVEEACEKGRTSFVVMGIIIGTLSIPLIYLDFITLTGTFYREYVLAFDSGYVLLCYLIAFHSFRYRVGSLARQTLHLMALFVPLGFICGTLGGFYPSEIAFFPLMSIIVALLLSPVAILIPLESFILVSGLTALAYWSSAMFAGMASRMNEIAVSQVELTLFACYFGSYVIYLTTNHFRIQDYFNRKELKELSRMLEEERNHLEELVAQRYKELIAENEARRIAEGKLKEMTRRYQTIVEHSFQAILETDPSGRILSCDFASGVFLGWNPEDLLHRPLKEVLPREEEGESPLTPRDTWQFERWKTRDRKGQIAWLEVVYGRYDSPTGEDHLLIVARDATKEVELERRMEIQNRIATLGMLAEGIAHDFKNSLTLLLGIQELLEETRKNPDSPLEELISLLGSELERLKWLVQELLGFSAEHRALTQPVELSSFFKEFYPFLRRVVPENMDLEIPRIPALQILAHPVELKNIFLNLVINARDALPEGGKVTIEFQRRGEQVIVKVRDNGVGMPPEVRDRAFEPFFTTKPPGRGTGLGLTMVKEWMERWQGQVELESQPGSGTTVTLFFQIAPPVSDAPARAEIHTESLQKVRGKRILIVEDSPELRWLMVTMLERFSFLCEAVGDLGEAIQRIRTKPYDLIISDYLLRSGKGSDLCEILRQSSHDPPPFLLMTGYTFGEIAELERSRAIAGILEKPFTSEELIKKIVELMTMGGEGKTPPTPG